MIGMSVSSFLTLLVIGAVCALVFRSMLKVKVFQTREGYLCALITGWTGAWIGSPVLGYWSWMVPGTNVYLVPALLGSIATIYTLAACSQLLNALLAPLSVHTTAAHRTKEREPRNVE